MKIKHRVIKKEILNECNEYKVIQGESIITQYSHNSRYVINWKANKTVKCRIKKDQKIRG